MSKHTKGPWVCEYEGDPGRPYVGEGNYLAMVEGRTVAMTPVPIHGIPWPRDEAIANIRLISAAPDLLNACDPMGDGAIADTLIQLAEKYSDHGLEILGRELQERTDRRRAAIAKAEGDPK